MKPRLLLLLFLCSTVVAKAQFATYATSHTKHTNTGSVYIGSTTNTTAPLDKLEVIGNVRGTQFNATSGIFNVPNTTSDLALRTNGTTRLLIDKTTGKIRIGSATAAAYELDVTGTVNATTLRIGGTTVVSSQWTTASSNINYTAGIVSIGTTTAPAGYKLAVGGKTVTEEVVVKLQANWPDYVFANDYYLMPLMELERYINQHKHLPEVPSATDVKENGVALGELNATLLKKIEELTLYMIELKKENEAQQKQIEALLKKD